MRRGGRRQRDFLRFAFVSVVVLGFVSACSLSSLDGLTSKKSSSGGAGGLDGSVEGSATGGVATGGTWAGGSSGASGSAAGGTSGGGVGGATSGAGGQAGGAGGSCTCAPPPPSGWTYVSEVVAAASCPTSDLGVWGTGAEDDGCGACTCDPPTGMCRQTATVGDGSCTSSPRSVPFNANGDCYVGKAGEYARNDGMTFTGACVAKAAIGAPRLTGTKRLCEAATMACGPQQCVPEVPKQCVTRTGTAACPAAFPNRTVYGQTFTGTRTCTGCSCAAPSGVDCGDDELRACAGCAASCAGPLNGCLPIDGVGLIARGDFIPSGGTCAPQGTANASGSLGIQPGRVVCCAP